MNVYRNVVLPVLYGLAAILVSVAAVVVVVGQVRGDNGDGGDNGREDSSRTAAALADALPALRGFAQSGALPDQLAHTYLGVNVAEQEGAVVVESVLPGGPADEAGVQVGDTVRSVNGTAVATVDELRTALAAITDGDEYTVDITRGGIDQSLAVQRMSLEDAMRAGIGRAFDRFRERTPNSRPSATPRPATRDLTDRTPPLTRHPSPPSVRGEENGS